MKTIVLISPDMALMSIIEKMLQDCYRVVAFKTMQAALDYIYNSIPNLIILDVDLDDHNTITILSNLKEDPIFSQLPVLAILNNSEPTSFQWENLLVEDFLWKEEITKELITRTELSTIRSERMIEINPLTRLPGNISINKQIQDRFDNGNEFAFAYADLDHFKPFNDYYGFSRGDEVIKVTGRLILNTAKGIQPKDSFVGHIGGDDFVFIMDFNVIEEAAEEIINSFDRIIPTFYDSEDRERGSIQSMDRQGNIKQFPIIALSIGITHNRQRAFTHYGELTEIASTMKSNAKHHKGSCWQMDKRQNLP
ncbi:MAG: diguanylate cyclase response regulator [Syntrophus sp. (in: bacteria)]|nr:diguanylate cyclase response regulator [Syntrophus sp. (in: bacteria)]